MGAETNFLQWNNGGVNQETDPEYLADPLRLGGAPTDAILPSPVFNKALYQLTTFVAAFCNMLALKGINTSDSDIAVLTAALSNVVIDTDLSTPIVAVTYSPTPTLNCTKVNGFYLALTGNSNVRVQPGSLSNGQIVTMIYRQDGAGGRTIFLNAPFTGGVTPDPTPNTTSVQMFIYNGFTGELAAVGPLVSDTGIRTINGTFSGQVGVAGQVTAATLVANGMTINGAASITGQLTVGSVSAGGNVVAGGLISTGSAIINGGLTVNNVAVAANMASGTLQVGGPGGVGNVLAGNGSSMTQQSLASLVGAIFGGNLSPNGWLSFPNGLIIQWATGVSQSSTSVVTQTVNFPRSFPTQCFVCIPGINWTGGSPDDAGVWAVDGSGVGTASVTLIRLRSSGFSQAQISAPTIFAIGK
jgi:hypothetical protein